MTKLRKTKDEIEIKSSVEARNVNERKLIKRLDFLKKMYDMKLPLTKEEKKLLVDNKYIGQKVQEELPKKPAAEHLNDHVSSLKTDAEKEIDASVDIIVDDDAYNEKEEVVIVPEKVFTDITNDPRYVYRGGKTITKENWYPKDRIYHTQEFVEWIDSINSGFQRMVPYAPFQMYCQQADDWLADKDTIYDYDTTDSRREFAWTEMDRIKENSLYFLDKYLNIKEAAMDSGGMKYYSKPAHKVMAFLMDCGYSCEIGKGRQMAATTTVGGLALAKLLSNKNFFIKMIAQDKEKVQEIFDDKIKFPFSELPDWMRPEVLNDRDNLLYIGSKEQKGKKRGVNSKIQVVAPTPAAINGGAPPLVLIDEGGYIPILGRMIKEARPTMFMQDPKTDKITMKRQIWIWGTGGEMDKNGKAFEEEYATTIKKWQNREFDYGIIPIFFDWTCRPGATLEHYNKEKKAYTVEGPEAEERMVQFRQAYPAIMEDMFLTSQKTLISIGRINRMLEKIRGLEPGKRVEFGYFEPIFDTSKPSADHDDLPYKVIDAVWVPCNDDDPRVSTGIFLHPEPNWVDRYYQGTDPISVDNGYSNMASSIWDSYYDTPVAITNYRHPDHKQSFLQCMLLGIYYDRHKKAGVPDLVEANIGTAYMDYKEHRGFGRTLVLKMELPSQFHGGQNEIGIDNRVKRTKFIISKMHELIEAYGDNIYFEVFWYQLSKFVCKITEKGNETWETQDYKKYHDDVLFSTNFSYICSISFIHRPPRNIEQEQDKVRVTFEMRRDSKGQLYRQPVRKKIY